MLTRQHNLSDREKRYLKSSKGIKAPFSLATLDDAPVTVKKVREFNAPHSHGHIRNRRALSGCRMSHEKRLLVLERCDKRAAFFAALRGE
jgi:hypothetical protein